MIITGSWPERTCLEADSNRNTLSAQPCTGHDRQRFKIRDGIISTITGKCLRPPDDASIMPITEANRPDQRSNCSVKLIPCPEQPIKTRFISKMLRHKKYVLATKRDSTICYLDISSIKGFFQESTNHLAFGIYFQPLSDWDHDIQRCHHDERTLEYPEHCESANTGKSDYQRSAAQMHRTFCNGLIKPYSRTIIPEIPGFPLQSPADSRRIEHVIVFDGSFIPRSNVNGMIHYSKKYIFTGLYTNPGDIFHVNITSKHSLNSCINALKDVILQVNMHSDDLSEKLRCRQTGKNSDLLRPPSIHIKRVLYQGTNTIRSPYGGTIWIISPRNPSYCKLRAAFSNVFRAPHFKHGETPSSWSINSRTSPPWSVLEGRRLTTVLPTAQAAKLKHPQAIVELMDQMVDETLKLWGYDVNTPHPSAIHHPGDQNDILVDDIQITSGDAHTGSNDNPAIMVSSKNNPAELLDIINNDNSAVNRLTKQGLSELSIIPHELGHHLHHIRLLTTVDQQVIAEITAEYANEKIFGFSLIAESCAHSRALEMITSQHFKYSDLPMPFQIDYRTGAVFLREIIDAFPNKGWSIFTNMARHYRGLKPEVAQQLIAASPQNRTDYFFELLCNLTHHNLADHFTVWKIPVSESIKSKVSHFPATDQPISILSYSNKRINHKVKGDAPHCPVASINTAFSETQKELLTTYGFLVTIYGLYLLAKSGKSDKQETTKIKAI